MKYRKVLITGGCGFLGQHLINNLTNRFPSLIIKVVDLKSKPPTIFNFNENPNVEVALNKDICDYDAIEKECKDIEAIIHLAGVVSFALKDKGYMDQVNIGGTQNILKIAFQNRVKSFIHISSVAALGYGDDRNKPIDETFIYDWNIARAKKKYYMLSKYIADQEVEKARENGLRAVILYPGAMFGPGDINNSSRLILAMKDRKIMLNMPGGYNVIDVRDVSAGIVAILEKKISDGNYILSGNNLSIKEINKIISDRLRVNPPWLRTPRILNSLLFRLMFGIESKFNTRLTLTADNTDSAFKFRYYDNAKAKHELGWFPKISFERTIRDTVKWMDDNGLFGK